MTQVILALDLPNRFAALELVDQLQEELEWVKVGMQLFYSEGPQIVKELKEKNLKVFLDLKLHDIPNTVSSALHSLLELEVDMVNVHCMGGAKMLWSASEAAKDASCLLIGVTQLTSSSEEQVQRELGLRMSLKESVAAYATMAKMNSLDGIVCSAHEVESVKEKLGQGFVCVCPGIRFEEEEVQDQVRVATPSFAASKKADFIVMGRSISKAKDPMMALKRAKKEIEEAFDGE